MKLPGRPLKRFAKLATKVAPIAPTLAGQLGGPIAGLAVTQLAKAFGAKTGGAAGDTLDIADGRAVDAVVDFFDALSGDAVEALHDAEQGFTAEIDRLGLDLAALEVADRESARDLAGTMVKAGRQLWPQLALSVVAVVGFGFVLWHLMSEALPPDNRDLIVYMVGQLCGFTSSAFGFWLASSHGSKQRESSAPPIR